MNPMLGPFLVVGVQTLTFDASMPVEVWAEVDIDAQVRIECDSNSGDTVYEGVTSTQGRHAFLLPQSRWHCKITPWGVESVIFWVLIHEYNRGRDDVVIDYNYNILGDDRGIRKL